MKTSIHFKYLFGLLVLMTVAGCASPKMTRVAPPPEVTSPSSDKAVVVFLRPSDFGGAIQSSVFDMTADDKLVGIVSANTMVAYETAPGDRMFMVIGESADFMRAHLDPGKTYYALVRPRVGVWKARFSFRPIRGNELDGKEFKNWIGQCHYVENTELSLRWADDHRGSIQAKKQEYLPVWESKSEAARREQTLFAEDGR